jgi:hypothetical protein
MRLLLFATILRADETEKVTCLTGISSAPAANPAQPHYVDTALCGLGCGLELIAGSNA